MVITEIFKSIQGEGTRAGLPCIFVRLTGCNLRCTWCDTAYAFHGGKKMSVEEVLACVDELAGRREEMRGSQAAVPLVELTGGEPLLQAEIYPLAEKLVTAKYAVMIETSGERFIGELPPEVIKIVDVKCPDSGEPDTSKIHKGSGRASSRARSWNGFWLTACRCGWACNCTSSSGTRRPRAFKEKEVN